MKWRAEVRADDMAVSGPGVWPRSSGLSAVDRMIFRRPELAYRVAWRRLEESRAAADRDPPATIGVRLVIRWVDPVGTSRSSECLGDFTHTRLAMPADDVRAFLLRLRAVADRWMPDGPLLNASLQLRFFDSRWKSREVLAWQERWA